MNRAPLEWAALGRALRDDRNRQGLTKQQLVDRVRERGINVTSRTLGTLEAGEPPKRGGKRPKLEPVAAALGWQPGATDRILSGEDPGVVLGDRPASTTDADDNAPAVREYALELLPGVYEFSRAAVAAGGASRLRDEVDAAAARLVASMPTGSAARSASSYGLVAYRPHGPGEPVPADDAERIARAMGDK